MCVCVCGGGGVRTRNVCVGGGDNTKQIQQNYICPVNNLLKISKNNHRWTHLSVSLEVGVSSRPLQYLQHALRKGNPHNDVQLSIVQEHLRGQKKNS